MDSGGRGTDGGGGGSGGEGVCGGGGYKQSNEIGQYPSQHQIKQTVTARGHEIARNAKTVLGVFCISWDGTAPTHEDSTGSGGGLQGGGGGWCGGGWGGLGGRRWGEEGPSRQDQERVTPNRGREVALLSQAVDNTDRRGLSAVMAPCCCIVHLSMAQGRPRARLRGAQGRLSVILSSVRGSPAEPPPRPPQHPTLAGAARWHRVSVWRVCGLGEEGRRGGGRESGVAGEAVPRRTCTHTGAQEQALPQRDRTMSAALPLCSLWAHRTQGRLAACPPGQRRHRRPLCVS